MTNKDGHEEYADGVGSLSEEAAQLFATLAGLARGVDAHVATGGADCLWCPVCRVIHVVREASPEVRAHLAEAGASLLQAAAGLLAGAVPDPPNGGTRRQRVDLDDDTEDVMGQDVGGDDTTGEEHR
jgi:hypothetical protein